MAMKYFQMVQVIFLICLINLCVSIDSEGNSATSTREIEQPLQQHEQDSDQQQLAPQEVHQSEYSNNKNSQTLPSYWLPLMYHLKHKRQPESNQMQFFESDGDLLGPSDLSEDVISSRQQPSLSSAVTGIRSNEVDLLDRLSLADSTNESPYGPSLRTLSTFSVPNRRWKIFRTGRTGYSRHSRKPDASKLGSFAAGNQQLVSFIQDMFGSKDGRGVRFGLS